MHYWMEVAMPHSGQTWTCSGADRTRRRLWRRLELSLATTVCGPEWSGAQASKGSLSTSTGMLAKVHGDSAMRQPIPSIVLPFKQRPYKSLHASLQPGEATHRHALTLICSPRSRSPTPAPTADLDPRA